MVACTPSLAALIAAASEFRLLAAGVMGGCCVTPLSDNVKLEAELIFCVAGSVTGLALLLKAVEKEPGSFTVTVYVPVSAPATTLALRIVGSETDEDRRFWLAEFRELIADCSPANCAFRELSAVDWLVSADC
jgi:hypothetical protein